MIKIEDATGKLIQFFICAIIWYSELIQHKFFQIPNFLLMLGMGLLLSIAFDQFQDNLFVFVKRIPSAAKIQIVYLLLALAFGMVATTDLSTHLRQWITCAEYMFVMMAIVYYGITRKSLVFLLKNLVVLYAIMSIMFIQHPVYFHDKVTANRLSFSADTNPNGFAIGLALGLWALLTLVSMKRMPSIVTLPFIGLMLYSIILTGSRKGLIGAGIILIGWLVLNNGIGFHKRFTASDAFRILLLLICSAIVLYYLVPQFFQSDIAARMNDLSYEVTEGKRSNLYQEGWQYLKKAPIFGYGFGGYSLMNKKGFYSHSTLVEVPVSNGVPLAALYFFSYYDMFVRLIGRWKNKTGNSVRIRQGVALFIVMMFYTICIIHPYQLSSYVSFGLIIICYSLSEEKEEHNEIAKKSKNVGSSYIR